MEVLTGTIPHTGVPFPLAEYKRRVERVLERVEETHLDAIAVTAEASQEYLTGYSGVGDYFAPYTLVLTKGEPPAYVVRKYDEDAVRSQSWIRNVVPFVHEGEQARTLANTLDKLGLRRARLGMELGSWNLAPNDVTALREALPDATIVDATRLVPLVAAIKSQPELEVMRASAALTDIAIETFYRSVRVGATELGVAQEIDAAVEKAGGDIKPYQLLFGQRTALPHGFPSRYAIRPNEPAFTELAAWKHGYAAAICRSLVVGRHAQAERLYDVAEAALAAVMDATRPGVSGASVDAACRRVLERAGKSATFRHRTGYQEGVHWFYRGGVSLEPTSNDVLEADMTLHVPINLFEQGEFGTGLSQTVLVTAHGAEPLSRIPTTLERVS